MKVPYRTTLIAAAASLFAMPAIAQDADVQEGPYQLRNVNLYYVNVTFDPDAVDAILPPGIEAAEGYAGGVGVYTVDEGFGVAPFTAGYIYVNVQGFDAPDGALGRYILAGFYSDPAFSALDQFLPNLELGQGRIEIVGDQIVGTAGFDGQDLIRIALGSPDVSECIPFPGVNHYLGRADGDHIMVLPYVVDFCAVDAISFEILDDSSPLAALAPVSLTGASVIANSAFTIGNFLPLE